MPQRSKGPRLYLEKRAGREPFYIIRDGARRSRTGCGVDDVEGAREALKAYLATHFRPDPGQRDLAQVNCAEVLTMYAADLPPDSPSATTIGYHIANLVGFWGAKSLADVKGSACRAYVKHRHKVKPSTARQELKTFQAAINHWHRESPLPAVPKVTLPKPGERRERVLERSEVARLLLACRRLSREGHKAANGAIQRTDYSHVARFILIGIYTGTRHAAIIRLNWISSLHGGHIDLDRQIIYRRGAAERETSKRRTPVVCGRRLNAHLDRWRRLDAGLCSNVIHYNGAPVAKMKRAWATVVKAAGLGPDVTPHVLRHTCASWLLWGGATIWDVAGIIGADASTVDRVYGHHRRIEQQEGKRAYG